MFVKLALLSLACFGLLLANAPASLLDLGLAAVSGNVARLSHSEGTLWHGRGIVVAYDTAGLHATPWLPLAWHVNLTGLLRGELSWSSDEGSAARGELSLGPGGFRLHDVALRAPAAVVFPMFPESLAHVGWGGDVALQTSDWRCSPAGNCEGVLLLQWRGASSALLPGQRLGDYEIRASGDGKVINFAVRTLAGEITLAGTGSVSGNQLPTFQGRISSPPEVLKLLPNIAAGVVLPDGAPGNFVVRYPVRP